jgi:hypothetical protein
MQSVPQSLWVRPVRFSKCGSLPTARAPFTVSCVTSFGLFLFQYCFEKPFGYSEAAMKAKPANFDVVVGPENHPRGCRILVLGDPSVASYLRRGLERRGCLCLLATSHDEATDLATHNDFRLIISTIPVQSNHALLSQLRGSPCTVVAYQPSGGISCWLPVMLRGLKCDAAPALSATEMIDLVDRALGEGEHPVAACAA